MKLIINTNGAYITKMSFLKHYKTLLKIDQLRQGLKLRA